MKTNKTRVVLHKPLFVGALTVLLFIAIGSGVVIHRGSITNPTTSASAPYPADINDDGTVGIADLLYSITKQGNMIKVSDSQTWIDNSFVTIDANRQVQTKGGLDYANSIS